jgi:plastocyanin
MLGVMTAACGQGAPVEPASESSALIAPATLSAVNSTDAGLAHLVGMAPPARGEVGSIILLDSDTEIDVALPDDTPVMDQYGRMFNPGFLLVRQGETVTFTNSEEDLHTVHVKDSAGESLFNIATLMESRYDFTFDREDSYDVVCNTHTEMQANILVVSSPYAVLAERDGSFTVPGVIPGSYTVTVLNGQNRTEREIEIVTGRNELDLTGL